MLLFLLYFFSFCNTKQPGVTRHVPPMSLSTSFLSGNSSSSSTVSSTTSSTSTFSSSHQFTSGFTIILTFPNESLKLWPDRLAAHLFHFVTPPPPSTGKDGRGGAPHVAQRAASTEQKGKGKKEEKKRRSCTAVRAQLSPSSRHVSFIFNGLAVHVAYNGVNNSRLPSAARGPLSPLSPLLPSLSSSSTPLYFSFLQKLSPQPQRQMLP